MAQQCVPGSFISASMIKNGLLSNNSPLQFPTVYSTVPRPLPNYPKVNTGKALYNKGGCFKGKKTACGPSICYTCPIPNTKYWNPEEEKKSEMDPVRRNIYYGGIICDFKPRQEINDNMCNRTFLSGQFKTPWHYQNVTDTEFYLQQGENSSCSKHWGYRYQKQVGNMGDQGSYQRIGYAKLNDSQ